jgi:RNA polymerase sigma-70 factor (TIGR02960 family)
VPGPAGVLRHDNRNPLDGRQTMAVPANQNATFEDLARRHHRELHVHCYRMLASFDEAEDAVQETLLRAWRARDTLETEQSARAWLYKIATNVCLNLARSRSRRLTHLRSFAEVSWLQPYPDRLLDEIASPHEQPDAVAVARETIELAFLAALQVLPPRQRAALLARDVLNLTAAETAEHLGISVAAANSALQRARAGLQQHLPSHRSEWTATEPDPAERDVLARFIEAHERNDAAGAIAAAATDLRVTMPPHPMCFDGVASIGPLLERAFGPDREGDWRLLSTRANRMPAAASYLRRFGDNEYRAFKLDVLRVAGGGILEITTFGHALFPHFGLPEVVGRPGS